MKRTFFRLFAGLILALLFAPNAFAQPCPVTYEPALKDPPKSARALGHGQLPPVGSWVAVAATFYSVGDSPGKFHVNGKPLNPRDYPCTFAELSANSYDFSAMGKLPDGTLMAVYCPSTRHRVMLAKRDVGRGGKGIGTLQRAFDVWNAGTVSRSAAKWCGLAGVKKIYIMRLPAKAARGGIQPDYGAKARWDGQAVPKIKGGRSPGTPTPAPTPAPEVPIAPAPEAIAGPAPSTEITAPNPDDVGIVASASVAPANSSVQRHDPVVGLVIVGVVIILALTFRRKKEVV